MPAAIALPATLPNAAAVPGDIRQALPALTVMLTQGAVNFLIAEKYIAALHALAQSPNQKLVIVPMELSSLAGTLGGLSQIAASAMGAETVAAPRPSTRPRPSGAVPNAGATHTPQVSPWQGHDNAPPGGAPA